MLYNLLKTKVKQFLLINLIERYLNIGNNHPDILSTISTNDLFPRFSKNINYLKQNLDDFSTEII